MATNDSRAVIAIDLVKDLLDLCKCYLVLGTKIGTFLKLLDLLVQ